MLSKTRDISPFLMHCIINRCAIIVLIVVMKNKPSLLHCMASGIVLLFRDVPSTVPVGRRAVLWKYASRRLASVR